MCRSSKRAFKAGYYFWIGAAGWLGFTLNPAITPVESTQELILTSCSRIYLVLISPFKYGQAPRCSSVGILPHHRQSRSDEISSSVDPNRVQNRVPLQTEPETLRNILSEKQLADMTKRQLEQLSGI
jgi:hypothetical protein